MILPATIHPPPTCIIPPSSSAIFSIRFDPRAEKRRFQFPATSLDLRDAFFAVVFCRFCNDGVYCRRRFSANLRLFVSPHHCETTSVVRLWTNILSRRLLLHFISATCANGVMNSNVRFLFRFVSRTVRGWCLRLIQRSRGRKFSMGNFFEIMDVVVGSLHGWFVSWMRRLCYVRIWLQQFAQSRMQLKWLVHLLDLSENMFTRSVRVGYAVENIYMSYYTMLDFVRNVKCAIITIGE